MVHALSDRLERERVRVRELEVQRNQLQEELGRAREEAEMARQVSWQVNAGSGDGWL